MYLKYITLKNIGPISELTVKLPFNDNGTPKPILFVGENGSGKTFLMSQIIDSLYEIGSNLFDDVALQSERGNGRSYYKVSGKLNIQNGCDYGFSLLNYNDFENNKIEYFDKSGLIEKDKFKTMIDSFNLVQNNKDDNQKVITSIQGELKIKLMNEWESGVHIYQPAYRYEEPFWKNDLFYDQIRFEDKKRFTGKLDKELEIISSTKANKTYLMDLVLDFMNNPNNQVDKVIWASINVILQQIKKKDNIRFGIGPRGGYRVSIVELNEDKSIKKQFLSSIDRLSLGESILLNLFVNIIRHGDTPPKALDEIQGIVAIDEIDVHLHTDLQNTILPQLIKVFPKVQFIITTHSPLFVLGMKRTFGENGFEIRNMPNGEVITTERFSEFENAYKVLKETEQFEKDVDQKITESQKPIVFVEGDYDIKYITKACELFGKEELLNKFSFEDADGYQNLNKIWQHKTNLLHAIPQDMLLLYDCDTKIDEGQRDKVCKKIIPYIDENLFDRGIENLFPKTTIEKAREHKKAFIDYTPEVIKQVRGEDIVAPEEYLMKRATFVIGYVKMEQRKILKILIKYLK